MHTTQNTTYLPISRLHRYIKMHNPEKRISKNTSAILAIVIQSIVSKLLVKTIQQKKYNKKTKKQNINIKDIQSTISNDTELSKIFSTLV